MHNRAERNYNMFIFLCGYSAKFVNARQKHWIELILLQKMISYYRNTNEGLEIYFKTDDFE